MEDTHINLYIKEKLTSLKGIGKKRAELFEKLNIYTIEDLINHFPRDYEDRRNMKNINEIFHGEKYTIRGIIITSVSEYTTTNKLKILSFKIKDQTGMLKIVFYNRQYLKNNFKKGDYLIFYGYVKQGKEGLEIHNPVYEDYNDKDNLCKIVPIYPSTEKLSQNLIRRTIEDIMPMINNFIPEYLPEDILKRNKLISLPDAYSQIHIPFKNEDIETAKKRLIFDEIFILEVSLFIIKSRKIIKNAAISFKKSRNIDVFIAQLDFILTDAQKRVIDEVVLDMEKDITMNRLIQGDVGSGKTVVAGAAIMNAFSNDYQSVLMAPTEILARQHYITLNKLYKNFNINIGLLISGIKKNDKDVLLHDISIGKINVVVGTHAIIQKNVVFSKLGLVITDEQHRFGVKQRKLLSDKGNNPDVLVMTATPIPRTLSLIIFGDLDISIIDELPPGRQIIDTHIIDESKRERLYGFIRKNVKAGRQVYYVLPLVEESDSLDLNSVEETFKIFKSKVFKELNVGIIHGKMKDFEKEETMNLFINKGIDILVSTTVIEVGVDIPNVNLIVVENAERFGLSQLHQLRGRVGRGEHKSFCILLLNSKSQKSKKRMEIIKSNTDGYKISNYDLEQRGPGEFFGFKQHGLPEFKIANMSDDIKILEMAQYEAKKIIENGIDFSNGTNYLLKKKIDDYIDKIYKDIELN
jgi:ATP-dependent DNA helicase RecG